jgi:hypothetical protein
VRNDNKGVDGTLQGIRSNTWGRLEAGPNTYTCYVAFNQNFEPEQYIRKTKAHTISKMNEIGFILHTMAKAEFQKMKEDIQTDFYKNLIIV